MVGILDVLKSLHVGLVDLITDLGADTTRALLVPLLALACHLAPLSPSIVTPNFVHLTRSRLFRCEDLSRHVQVMLVLQAELQYGGLLLFMDFALVGSESLLGVPICLLGLLKLLENGRIAFLLLKALGHLLLVPEQQIHVSVPALEFPSEGRVGSLVSLSVS